MIEHDPLCPYTPEQSGFGGINSGISSTQPYVPAIACQCDLIAKVREDAASFGRGKDFYDAGKSDMLAKCIEAVHQMRGRMPYWWVGETIDALRALQQPVGPIEDLTDDEVDAYYKALEENT